MNLELHFNKIFRKRLLKKVSKQSTFCHWFEGRKTINDVSKIRKHVKFHRK
jgi:hypothetical protein